jgi:hypothetical protein
MRVAELVWPHTRLPGWSLVERTGAGIEQEDLSVLPNVVFREVDEQTLDAVLAVTLTPAQEPYVGSVAE